MMSLIEGGHSRYTNRNASGEAPSFFLFLFYLFNPHQSHLSHAWAGVNESPPEQKLSLPHSEDKRGGGPVSLSDRRETGGIRLASEMSPCFDVLFGWFEKNTCNPHISRGCARETFAFPCLLCIVQKCVVSPWEGLYSLTKGTGFDPALPHRHSRHP